AGGAPGLRGRAGPRADDGAGRLADSLAGRAIAMRRRWAWSLAAVLAACCPPPAEPAPPPGPAAPARDAVEEHARRLLAEARAIEPVITPLLLELAERAHGDMVKLEHRFKSLASTQRKLRQRMSQD